MSDIISCGKEGIQVKIGKAWIRIGPTELREAGLMSGRGPVPLTLTDEQKKGLMAYAIRKYGDKDD